MTLFNENTVTLDLQAVTKEAAIDEMIGLLDGAGILNDAVAYKQAIYAREELSTTGIGFGIAIPHAKSGAVNRPRVAFGLSKQGVEYGSEDGKKVNLIFMIAVSDTDSNLHVQMLAKLSRKLISPVFRNSLQACTDKAQVMDLFISI